jgi:hypothetical protein
LGERPATFYIDKLLFVHAGISAEMARVSQAELNQTVAEHLARFDQYRTFMINKGLILPSSDARTMVRAAKEYLDAKKLPPNEPDLSRKQRRAFFAELEDFLDFRGGWLLDPSGPLWYRGYAKLDDAAGKRALKNILEAYEPVEHIIVGHSPRANGMIQSRFEGAVFLIDTGMLESVYNGQPAALEINNGVFTAIYRGHREVLLKTASHFQQVNQPPTQQREVVPATGTGKATEAPQDGSEDQSIHGETAWLPWPMAHWMQLAYIYDEDEDDVLNFELPPFLPIYAKGGAKLPFESYEDVLEFLSEAEVIESKEVGDGITKPLRLVMEKDGVQMRAIFRHVNDRHDRYPIKGKTYIQFRDSYAHEVAAFRLALLLGINRVPVAMPYRFNGKSGSIQVWVENARTERMRVEGNIKFPEELGWNQQAHLMRAFDALIYNIDRHGGNMLYDQDWTLWFIDHTRGFQVNKEPFQGDSVFFVDKRFWKRLKEVEDDEIKQVLEPFMDRHHVKALLKRRKKLVAHIEKILSERGETVVMFELKP